MSGLYRNIGAPFRRSNGETVGRGDEFHPTDDEIIRRRHKLVPVTTVAPPPVVVETWPLRMSPKRYLSLHPDGEWVRLARKLVQEEK